MRGLLLCFVERGVDGRPRRRGAVGRGLMGDAIERGLKSAEVEMADAECKAGVTLNVGFTSKDLDLLLNALI